MLITSGIYNHSVLQRNEEDICSVQISGFVNHKNSLTVKVTDYKNNELEFTPSLLNLSIQPLPANNNSQLNIKYSLSAILTGIPVGGPYTISFHQGNIAQNFSDVLVGDVYLLAGQSNMQGIGQVNQRLLPLSHVRAFYMNDQWKQAFDPIHNLDEAVDPIHTLINGGPIEPLNKSLGVGPGVAFAQELYRLTGVPQGIIACAHGGTSMAQWDPSFDNGTGYSLYKALLKRFNKNGSHVKGLFWYQGCSDTDKENSPSYSKTMENFIIQLRQDLNAPLLPIVAVQIARQCSHNQYSKYWNLVQDQQYELGETIHNLSVVPAIDLEMDDFIHISGKSHKRLGVRAAKSMLFMIDKTMTYKPPIKLKNIHVKTYTDSWNAQIILTYDHVIGKLQSKDRPSGFTVTPQSNQQDGNYIYSIELNNNQIILNTTEVSLDLLNYHLHYGLGFQPFCNIVDSENRSLPVLYSRPLGEYRNFSTPCTFAWLSKELLSPEITTSEKQLLQLLNQKLLPTDFYYFFLNVYNYSNKHDTNTKDYLVYHIPYVIEEDGDYQLILGGFGDFHVYNDSALIKQVSYLQGQIKPDQWELPLTLRKGLHLLAIKYISRANSPKGIFLRFETITQTTTMPIRFIH